MAILWQRTTAQGNYQVRTAGNTVRLYKDGVFHSHYNPGHIVTRGVWDLLVLPTLLYPPASLKKVLLLGVGGGAAIHLLNHFTKPARITAIELDAIHLSVAKRFFKVSYPNTELLHDDAVDWVRKKSQLKNPPKFDLIIDDLYGEENGEPVRAVSADEDWCQVLHSLLSPGGMIVSNFVTRKELKQSAYLKNWPLRKKFKSAFRFRNPHYQNEVAVFTRQASDIKAFRKNLSLHPELSTRSYRDTFSVQKLLR